MLFPAPVLIQSQFFLDIGFSAGELRLSTALAAAGWTEGPVTVRATGAWVSGDGTQPAVRVDIEEDVRLILESPRYIAGAGGDGGNGTVATSAANGGPGITAVFVEGASLYIDGDGWIAGGGGGGGGGQSPYGGGGGGGAGGYRGAGGGGYLGADGANGDPASDGVLAAGGAGGVPASPYASRTGGAGGDLGQAGSAGASGGSGGAAGKSIDASNFTTTQSVTVGSGITLLGPTAGDVTEL